MHQVDLEPYAALIGRAAARLADDLLGNPQAHRGHKPTDALALYADCLKGKKAEVAYAVANGLDPNQVMRDAKGKPDFGHNVDVKAVTRRAAGAWLMTINVDTLRKKAPTDLVAPVLLTDGWLANMVAPYTVADLAELELQGVATRHPSLWGAHGSDYLELRVYPASALEAMYGTAVPW